MSKFPIQIFDPDADYSIVERRLPHWSQAGTIAFITFRTSDSMPRSVIEAWRSERMSWLRKHGVDPTANNRRAKLQGLDTVTRREFYQKFSRRWQEELDACHGSCVLKNPELGSIVSQSLKHFDDQRYELTDFVVMPNHVHVLAAFFDEDSMLAQCESWKRFTATQINRKTGNQGRFWQQDGFDHLVRSLDQFEALRKYIAENPMNAHLRAGEYQHYSKLL